MKLKSFNQLFEGSTPFTPRDEMIKLLNKEFPNIWTKKGEEFKNEPAYKYSIWTGAENSTFIDDAKEIPAFNVYDPSDKDYDMEVHKDLAKFLKKHGWYTESYDAGTFFFWPINRPNEQEVAKFESYVGEGKKDKYMIFNRTDGFYASPEEFSKEDAEQFVRDFASRYKQQGYYRTGSGEKINPEDVELDILPTGANPFDKK